MAKLTSRGIKYSKSRLPHKYTCFCKYNEEVNINRHPSLVKLPHMVLERGKKITCS